MSNIKQFLQKVIKSSIHSKNVRNASWLIGEQLFQMLISFVLSILSARYLGPSNYGTLNYTASFVAFFTSIASVGLESVVLNKMIASPEKEGEYLGNSILLRLFAALFSSVSVSLIVFALNPSDNIKLTLVMLQSIQLVFKAFQILDYWFQRYLLVKYVAIGKMLASVIVSGYKIFLLAYAKSLIWFAVSNTLTDLIISFVLLCFYHKVKKQRIVYTLQHSKELLLSGYHFILSGIVSAVYTQMDKIMIGQMLTDKEVGFYSTALTICSMWMFVPQAIINTFRPSIMESYNKGEKDEYITRLKKLYAGVIWICIFASLFISFSARVIVTILYGEEYYSSILPIRVMIWSELFAMVGTARGIWIICEEKSKYVKYYLAIGAMVNLLLNWLFISHWGMIGAAIATLITQITTCIIAPLFFKETRVHTRIVLDSFLFVFK